MPIAPEVAPLDRASTERYDEHNGRAAADRTADILASFDTRSMGGDKSHTREEGYPSIDEYDRDCLAARGRATARAAVGRCDRKVLEELDVDIRQNHVWGETLLPSLGRA